MITFEILHWMWWIRGDNSVMERGTVLNFSMFAAIFLVSCFREIGGLPLDRSKVYWRYPHSTGRIPTLRSYRYGRENLVDTRAIYNHNKYLIDTTKELPLLILPQELFESNGNDEGIIIKAEQDNNVIDVNDKEKRVVKREIPDLTGSNFILGATIGYNVSHGIRVGPAKEDYISKEDFYLLNDAPMRSVSNPAKIGEGFID